jgi:hypothetical protein
MKLREIDVRDVAFRVIAFTIWLGNNQKAFEIFFHLASIMGRSVRSAGIGSFPGRLISLVRGMKLFSLSAVTGGTLELG